MNRRGAQWIIVVASVVLGLMLALQFKVQKRVNGPLLFDRSEQLTYMLRDAEKERDQLRDEVATLRQQLAEANSGKSMSDSVRDELNQARLAAGLTEVHGPGIKLILDDSKAPRQPGEDPNLFILHDDDLLKVVNELRAASAEAISLNGQRLVATSEIRCAGPTVSVNNTRTSTPVQILAIGDPEILASALQIRGGILDTLSFWGIQIKLTKENDITIPAYKGSLVFQFAKPTGGDGK